MKCNFFLFFFCWVAATINANGQSSPGAVLTGSVRDENSKPIEFAAVVLLSTTDSAKITQVTATDTAGGFAFTGVPLGGFKVKVTSIGHRITYSREILVTSISQILPVGTLTAASISTALREVVVQGERPIAERSLGKVTLNVTNSFFKTAPNALEVLRRAPGLQVDPLGVIKLNGTTTPVVYIDGRQNPISADEMLALSAEDMDQVEIIANASSRYDGTTRAVINIKLKRDKTLGLKGSMYTAGTLNREYAGSEAGASGTYKTKKWAYYGRAGFNRINNFTRFSSQRFVVEPNGNRTVVNDASFLHSQLTPLYYQGEATYSISKNQSISLFLKGLSRHSTDVSTSSTDLSTNFSAGQPANYFRIPSTTAQSIDFSNATADVEFKAKLNTTGDAVTINTNYAHFSNAQRQDFRTTTPGGFTIPFPQVLLGSLPTTTDIASARAEYTKAINKSLNTSFGTKVSRTKTDNELQYDTLATSGDKIRDASRSNHFLYSEWIGAAYAGVSIEKQKNSIDAVLRVEFTHSTGNSITLDQVADQRYYSWLPSIQAQHKFDEQNTLELAFSRKLQRASFYDLNPFRFYLTPYTFSEGNPFLLPATISSTEIDYTHKDVTLTAEYQLIRNSVQQLPIQNAQTKVLYYTRMNIEQVRNFIFSASSPITITKWWKMQHTLVLYHAQTLSPFEGGLINNQAWTFLVNGQQNFSLPGGVTIGLGYDFTSPGASQIYRTRSSGTVNLSAQKTVLQGKGNVQIYASDLFNTFREAVYGDYNGINITTTQTRSIQQVTARFTYRFGSSTYNRNGRVLGNAEEEKRANK